MALLKSYKITSLIHTFMSGFRAPSQQSNGNGSNNNNNGLKVNSRGAGGFSAPPQPGAPVAPGAATPTPTADAAAEDVPVEGEKEIHQIRTFDMYWVDRKSLMYHKGTKKTFDKKLRTKIFEKQFASNIPTILRDMSPPENSVFNPQEKWNQRKDEQDLAEKVGL